MPTPAMCWPPVEREDLYEKHFFPTRSSQSSEAGGGVFTNRSEKPRRRDVGAMQAQAVSVCTCSLQRMYHRGFGLVLRTLYELSQQSIGEG